MRPGGWLNLCVFLAAAGVASGCSADGVLNGDPSEVDPPAFAWPLPGVAGADWVINNYVDLDPTGALLDYVGGEKTYNGHAGTDIDVPNFRWMDDGFAVLAAASGEVTGLTDGHADRHVSCIGEWNYVQVTHEDGSKAYYGHLKTNSISVTMGQQVTPGLQLGVVGSSGCSTQPHLHFEVRNVGGAVIDPFLQEMWVAPPLYEPPLTFMDASFHGVAITGVNDLKDPPPNITSIASGATLGVGLSMAGGGVGDAVTVTLTGGDGSLEYTLEVTFDRVWRHTYWYWNPIVTTNPGTWTATVLTNGTPAATYDFIVS